MDFTPKTREEAEKESQFPIWEDGIYDFEVLAAEEQQSAKGNAMIKVTLKCFNQFGATQLVFDYLMPAFPVKLIDACEAMGLSTEYEAGCLKDYQLVDKTGKVHLSVKGETTNKDTGKKYAPKNEVSSYIVSNTQQSYSSKANERVLLEEEDMDDEMPF